LDNPELCERTPDSPKPGTFGISQGKDSIEQTGTLIQESIQRRVQMQMWIVLHEAEKYVEGVEEIK